MENLVEIFKESKSIIDVCKRLSYHPNGTGYNKVRKLIDEHNIDISHFDGGKSKRTIYNKITKECPVCGNKFETKEGHKREQTVCSTGCANTHYRSGEDHPNYKSIDEIENVRSHQYSRKYREICFNYHKHECCVCGENKLLDVHHFDGVKRNNNPENLIPICATHHNYIHSEYKDDVIDKVIEYRNKFINNGK